MGYFDPEWNRLPTTIKVHTLVAIFAIFIHVLLMIPVWIQMRKHEVQEKLQNFTLENNLSNSNVGCEAALYASLSNRSHESFAINCICMVISAIGSINLSYLNRYLLQEYKCFQYSYICHCFQVKA